MLENSCFYGHCFPSGTSGKEPACQCRRLKTWVQSLGQENPLENIVAREENGNPFQYSWLENPTDRSLVGDSLGCKELDTT